MASDLGVSVPRDPWSARLLLLAREAERLADAAAAERWLEEVQGLAGEVARRWRAGQHLPGPARRELAAGLERLRELALDLDERRRALPTSVADALRPCDEALRALAQAPAGTDRPHARG